MPTIVISACCLYALLFCLLSGCSDLPHREHDQIAAIEELLAAFETIVFQDEYDTERKHYSVRKWVEPVKIQLFGKQAVVFRPALINYAETLAALTGLHIRVLAQDQEKSNFEIHFVHWDDIAVLAKPYSPNPEWLETIIEDSSCLFIYQRDEKYEIKHAYIFVSINEPMDEIKSCLLEEMIQALGLPNDSEMLKPSIFNQWDHLQQLTKNDEILLRTIYDPGITPGMPKELALQKARIIMNELIHK